MLNFKHIIAIYVSEALITLVIVIVTLTLLAS
jgi:hypothetical protein